MSTFTIGSMIQYCLFQQITIKIINKNNSFLKKNYVKKSCKNIFFLNAEVEKKTLCQYILEHNKIIKTELIKCSHFYNNGKGVEGSLYTE